MANKIKYGIYPNPLPDTEGNTTYQVRHEPDGTMDTKAFLAHLKYHNTFNTTLMTSALIVLRDEIIEQLRNNQRFRIDGLGTFQMKVGLRAKTDEEGNPIKTVITHPKQLTARDVEVSGVSFIPDHSFVKELKFNMNATKSTDHGKVGRSNPYTRQEIVDFLDKHIEENGFITRRTFRSCLGLTDYAARKWLDQLTSEESPKYVARREGTTIIYRRYGMK